METLLPLTSEADAPISCKPCVWAGAVLASHHPRRSAHPLATPSSRSGLLSSSLLHAEVHKKTPSSEEVAAKVPHLVAVAVCSRTSSSCMCMPCVVQVPRVLLYSSSGYISPTIKHASQPNSESASQGESADFHVGSVPSQLLRVGAFL